ncbi:uncharacterized protein LOC126832624 isoform X2 [Patella vulgata]|uniref:uncharacterized protein LOC126832624 isoform X2 n=1 Tax=Patella vulgata TaxID=6465 RepID=UPI00217F8424|nr:uncharacterized protein LOC126832624 isoform X2 [Patella vulgata]
MQRCEKANMAERRISYTEEREICQGYINRNRMILRENVVPTDYLSHLSLSRSEIEPIESKVQIAGPTQEYKNQKIEDLKYKTCRVLWEKLNEDKNWLKLCNVFDITLKQKTMLDNSENPGEKLLELLSDVTVCDFITKVQEAGLKSLIRIFEESDEFIKFLSITTVDEQITRQAVFDQAEINLKNLQTSNVYNYNIRKACNVQIGSNPKMLHDNSNEDLSSTSPMAPSRSSSYASEYPSEEDMPQTQSAIPPDYSNDQLLSSSPKAPSRSSSSEYLSALDGSQNEGSSIFEKNPNKLVEKFDAVEYLRNEISPDPKSSNKDKCDKAEASDSSTVSVSNDSSGRSKPSSSDTMQNKIYVSQDNLPASEKTALNSPTESTVPPDNTCKTAMGVSQTREENFQNQDIPALNTAVCSAPSIPNQDINRLSLSNFRAEEETILKVEDSARNLNTSSLNPPSQTDHLPDEAGKSIRVKKESNDTSTHDRHGDGDSGLTLKSF